jgi:hypothetical protein
MAAVPESDGGTAAAAGAGVAAGIFDVRSGEADRAVGAAAFCGAGVGEGAAGRTA